MKTISTVLLIASGATVLLAIWAPVGAWWQWVITALILFLAGAGAGGSATKREHELHALGKAVGTELTPEEQRRVEQFYGKPRVPDQLLYTHKTKPTYGQKEDDK